MRKLEEKLGHVFSDTALLQTALTHSSYAKEHNSRDYYERLEFLGDSILGFCVAKAIYRELGDMPEGSMTKLRAELVCEKSLYEVAEDLKISDYLRIGKNEEGNGGRHRVSILADCIEAIIAALYLDAGLDTAENFIAQYILADGLSGKRFVIVDYKSHLQEVLQKDGGEPPAYEIIQESGPDHDKTFTARVSFPGGICEGVGKTKKEAERAAAQKACELLKI